MVYLANLLNPDILLLSRFSLNWAAVMHGEVWRLFTFVFLPQSPSPLGLVLTLYFYYLIGNTLETVSYTHLAGIVGIPCAVSCGFHFPAYCFWRGPISVSYTHLPRPRRRWSPWR